MTRPGCVCSAVVVPTSRSSDAGCCSVSFAIPKAFGAAAAQKSARAMRVKLDRKNGQPIRVLISMFIGFIGFSLRCFFIFLSFDLIFDLLFLHLGDASFLAAAQTSFYPVKRKSGLEGATTSLFRRMRCCKNLSNVLGFRASSRPYDSSLVFTARGDPTAGRLERRRRRRPQEADPTSATGIASVGTSLHEPGRRRPDAANHGAFKRGVPAAGR